MLVVTVHRRVDFFGLIKSVICRSGVHFYLRYVCLCLIGSAGLGWAGLGDGCIWKVGLGRAWLGKVLGCDGGGV